MRTTRALVAAAIIASATAVEYEISPGLDLDDECLLLVQPGDSCLLLEGNHETDGLTRTHGASDSRITIHGQKGSNGELLACIKGSNTRDRAFQVAHDYYTIEDLCFDGQHGTEYVSTAIYVLGADWAEDTDGFRSSVTGLQLFNLEINNWNEECVHLRYFVTHSEIAGCLIQNCGKSDFVGGGGGKVGEGIYVGTALDQVKDGKTPEVQLWDGSPDTPDADVCQFNWIHDNTIYTYGNECVDIKEGSTNNLVEYNVCEEQKDEDSGCFGARGSGNTFRYNEVSTCVGGGFRFGGDDGYGTDNNAYHNTIASADYAAFNMMAATQGVLCGNTIRDIVSVFEGQYKDNFHVDDVTGGCSSEPGDIDGFTSRTPGSTTTTSAAQMSSDSGGTEAEPTPEPEEVENSYESYGDVALLDIGSSTDICVGVNCFFVDDVEEGEVYPITTNSNAGNAGVGECKRVLPVDNVAAAHGTRKDELTLAENLLDGDVETYFSVNRESTFFMFELSEETEISGVSIGCYMKSAEEARIQKFSVLTRAAADEDWQIQIERYESSGVLHDLQYWEFTLPVPALYVKIETLGNGFNSWSAITEVEICGTEEEEVDALFGGVHAAEKELAMLEGALCVSPTLLTPHKVSVSDFDARTNNEMFLFDGNYETRWTTVNTQSENDLENAFITMTFRGEVKVSYIEMAFYDGDLAHYYFNVRKQSARSNTFDLLLEGEEAAKTTEMQTFKVNKEKVNILYIIGLGNEVGDYFKVSELKVYGC